MTQRAISELDTVLPCGDLERSKSSYRDKLGLTVEQTATMPGAVETDGDIFSVSTNPETQGKAA